MLSLRLRQRVSCESRSCDRTVLFGTGTALLAFPCPSLCCSVGPICMQHGLSHFQIQRQLVERWQMWLTYLQNRCLDRRPSPCFPVYNVNLILGTVVRGLISICMFHTPGALTGARFLIIYFRAQHINTYVVLMLGQRRKQRANIKIELAQRLVFVGYIQQTRDGLVS